MLLRLYCLLLLASVTIPGCRGCQRDQSVITADTTINTKKVADRIAVEKLRALPASAGSQLLLIKPGHWYEVQQTAKANLDDESVKVTCNVVDQLFHPLSTLGLREPIVFDRSVALAQGQEKRLDYQVFIPTLPPAIIDQDSAIKPQIRVNYVPRGIGVSIREEVYPITALPDYQYYLVSLSKSASRYQFLEGSTAFVWPSDGKLEEEKIFPIRFIGVEESDVAASLPSRLNTWTTTSHILWNDCSASALTELQKLAIVDWLHFGGQIIVNGPESQASLTNSFLSDYLPLAVQGSEESIQVDWEAFNRQWSLSKVVGEPGVFIEMPKDRIIPTVKGNLAKGARWVPGCDGIAAERTVGAGRVVMTTFPVAEATWVRWPSYSSFVNSVLLGRPPRVWVTDANQFGDFVFAEPYRGFEKDPTLTSRFRLLARDLGARSAVLSVLNPSLINDSLIPVEPQLNAIAIAAQNEAGLQNVRSDDLGGRRAVGELTAQGGFARASGQILREASGINVPSISTIVKLLSIYLVVLVPLNWIVFRLMGRVELAWVAAPLIALVGAFAVARSVQLDVGFSRSQTSISIIEVPTGYARGYAASFTSLYTSLTTNYSAMNLQSDGLVVPMSTRVERVLSFARDTSFMTYLYASESGEGLESFPVRSNSTSLIRAEQPCNIGGTVLIEKTENDGSKMLFINRSELDLTRVGIVAMDIRGKMRTGWIGDVRPGVESSIAMPLVPEDDLDADAVGPNGRKNRDRKKRVFVMEGWRARSSTEEVVGIESLQRDESVIDPSSVIESVLVNHRWRPGEALAIAFANQNLDLIEVKPIAPQRQHQSVFIFHAFPDSIGVAAPDLNLPMATATDKLNSEGLHSDEAEND